jgi:hypothetical protein
MFGDKNDLTKKDKKGTDEMSHKINDFTHKKVQMLATIYNNNKYDTFEKISKELQGSNGLYKFIYETLIGNKS